MKKYLFGGLALAAGIAAMLHPPQAKQAIVAATASPGLRVHRTLATSAAYAVVYVAGAVNTPGLYRLPVGSRAFAALKLAGGFGPNADTAGVNLAEVVSDGEEIAVPRQGERRAHQAAAARTGRAKTRSRKRAPDAPLDLNAAGAGALMQLPGVGEELARRIVQFREVNGPFVSLDELADVAGMTPRRIETLSAHVYVK